MKWTNRPLDCVMKIGRDISCSSAFVPGATSSRVPPPRATSPSEETAAHAESEHRFTERRERRYSAGMRRLLLCALMLDCARGPARPPANGLHAWLAAQAHDDPRAA